MIKEGGVNFGHIVIIEILGPLCVFIGGFHGCYWSGNLRLAVYYPHIPQMVGVSVLVLVASPLCPY